MSLRYNIGKSDVWGIEGKQIIEVLQKFWKWLTQDPQFFHILLLAYETYEPYKIVVMTSLHSKFIIAISVILKVFFINTAMSENGYFRLNTYCDLYFAVKTNDTTA